MVAKLGNICLESNICVREAKMFQSSGKSIGCFRAAKLPQRVFPARLNWETSASATMFPGLARPQ